jgi:hypothetical protein
LNGGNASGVTAGGAGGSITCNALNGNAGGSLVLAANASYPGTDVRTVFATPEASVTAPPGSIALRADNGTAWVKASGSSNTGWRQIPDLGTVTIDSASTTLAASRGNVIKWSNTAGGGVTIVDVSGFAVDSVYTFYNADPADNVIFDNDDADIVVRGGADLTLAPGESCTIYAVTATTISVH